MNQRRLPRGSRLFCMAACRRRAWPAVTGLSQPPFTVARFVTQGMVSMRMDTLDWRHKAIATACLALCGAAWSAPFTPGNLVAYRVGTGTRSEEHTSELQSQSNLVCRLLLEK